MRLLTTSLILTASLSLSACSTLSSVGSTVKDFGAKAISMVPFIGKKSDASEASMTPSAATTQMDPAAAPRPAAPSKSGALEIDPQYPFAR